jgi:hypothetical protein
MPNVESNFMIVSWFGWLLPAHTNRCQGALLNERQVAQHVPLSCLWLQVRPGFATQNGFVRWGVQSLD